MTFHLWQSEWSDLLENTIDPMITEIVENDDQIMIQHDSAPPNYAFQVREFLNERFPQDGLVREV